MDTRNAPGDPAASASELRERAAEYDAFAELGPRYRQLAADLRRRAAQLLDPSAGPHEPPADTPPETPAAPLMPRTREQVLAAWRLVIGMVTARRAGIDEDGAALLGDIDPRHALHAAISAVVSLLSAMDPAVAQSIVEHWALNAASASAASNG